MFDLIIRNGFVVDPESGFAGKSDVAVEDGRIAEVSESISSKGTEELDASGLTVQPASSIHIFTSLLTPLACGWPRKAV